MAFADREPHVADRRGNGGFDHFHPWRPGKQPRHGPIDAGFIYKDEVFDRHFGYRLPEGLALSLDAL